MYAAASAAIEFGGTPIKEGRGVSAASVVVPVVLSLAGYYRSFFVASDIGCNLKLRLQCEPNRAWLEAADFPDAGGKILTPA